MPSDAAIGGGGFTVDSEGFWGEGTVDNAKIMLHPAKRVFCVLAVAAVLQWVYDSEGHVREMVHLPIIVVLSCVLVAPMWQSSQSPLFFRFFPLTKTQLGNVWSVTFDARSSRSTGMGPCFVPVWNWLCAVVFDVGISKTFSLKSFGELVLGSDSYYQLFMLQLSSAVQDFNIHVKYSLYWDTESHVSEVSSFIIRVPLNIHPFLLHIQPPPNRSSGYPTRV